MNIASQVISAFLLIFSFPLFAKGGHEPAKLTSWSLVSNNSQQMDSITEKYEIVARHGNKFEIYVPADAVAEFQRMAPSATMLSNDTDAELRITAEDHPEFFAGYRGFDEVNNTLHALAQQYPEIMKIEAVGTSTGGRTQYALKISDNVNLDEDEPELLMTAATHGDEIITTEVLLRFIEEIATGYGHDQRLTTLVDDHELYFLPVVNPDGFSARQRYADGIDPNRDYPWPETPEKASVNIIANVINYFKSRNFVGSIDFHASGKLVMYPWAYTDSAPDHSDELIFDNLGRDMAAQNSYTYGQISRVIYVAKGSSADYYYWKFKTLAYGIEIADSKAPRTSEIPGVLTQVREMTLKFIEHF